MFPPIRYLEWIEGRKGVSSDLGTSGLGTRAEAIVPPRLEGLPDPPEGTHLESQIADRYDASVRPENVLVTAGTSHANFLAFAAALGRTDSSVPAIAVERPAYEPLVATPAGMGARVDRLDRDPGDGYTLGPEAVTGSIEDSTALAVLTNRHNPSGHLLERDELEEITATSWAEGVPLLVDEVYAPYLPEAQAGPGTAFGGPTAAGLDGAVVTNSLTKFFGFGGLRIGWMIASRQFIESATTVAAHLPDVAQPSRALARRAFHNLDTLMERSRARVRKNAPMLAEFVDTTEGVRGPIHPGSTFGFPAVADIDGDRLSEIAGEEGVLVIPGQFFEDSERFRISLSGPPAEMRSALERFEDVLVEVGETGE